MANSDDKPGEKPTFIGEPGAQPKKVREAPKLTPQQKADVEEHLKRDKFIRDEFVKRVKLEMEKEGLTQDKMAALLGMDPSTLSRILTGHRAPTRSHIRSMSVRLGISLGDIYAETLPEEKRTPHMTSSAHKAWVEEDLVASFEERSKTGSAFIAANREFITPREQKLIMVVSPIAAEHGDVSPEFWPELIRLFRSHRKNDIPEWLAREEANGRKGSS